MAFNVVLYTHNKKVNSTKHPTTSGTTFTCELKDNCNIYNPVVTFRGGDIASFNPVQYNFAYIPEFLRWYNIVNWEFTSGLWSATMEIDVLASWKDTIGNSVQYVTRSSVQEVANSYLTDNTYPALSYFDSEKVEPNSYPFTTYVEQGCIILGVAGGPLTDISTATYYVFSSTEFHAFCSDLFDNTSFLESFKNSFLNPLQYIVSCIWYPFDKSQLETIESSAVYFGWFEIDTSCTILKPFQYNKTFTLTFSASDHEQRNTHGLYLNYSPYTRRVIYWPPLGEVPLETSLIQYSRIINLILNIDLHSGNCDYRVESGTKLVTMGTCHLGVNMPVMQMTIDGTSYIKSALSLANNISSLNPIGTLNGVIDGLNSLMPQVSKSGSIGNLSAFTSTKPILRSDFLKVADYDTTRFGRPVFKIIKISDIPGFIKCSNANISATVGDDAITVTEQNAIIDFMNGGFYYE